MNTPRSTVVPAQAIRRKPCRHRCGVEVDTFTTEYGRPVQLDTHPAPINVDLAAHRLRLWEFRGERVGWCLKFSPSRTWRELRLEHQCATPERKHKSKRENKEEVTR